MKATQLIRELEEALALAGEGKDLEVRIAAQPRWAFEYSIASAATVEMSKDENGKYVVYLEEGKQIGYLPEEASDALCW